MSPASIKEHQESKLGVNIYFRQNLDEEKIRQAFSVFDLNEFIPEDFYDKKKIDQEEISTPPINIEDDMSDNNEKENDSLVFEVSTEDDLAPKVEETTEEEEIDLDFDLPGEVSESDTDIEMAMVDDIPEPEGDGLSLDSDLETEAISLSDGDLETEAISLGDGDLDNEVGLDVSEPVDSSDIDLEEQRTLWKRLTRRLESLRLTLLKRLKFPHQKFKLVMKMNLMRIHFLSLIIKQQLCRAQSEKNSWQMRGKKVYSQEELVAEEDDELDLGEGDFSLEESANVSSVEDEATMTYSLTLLRVHHR